MGAAGALGCDALGCVGVGFGALGCAGVGFGALGCDTFGCVGAVGALGCAGVGFGALGCDAFGCVGAAGALDCVGVGFGALGCEPLGCVGAGFATLGGCTLGGVGATGGVGAVGGVGAAGAGAPGGVGAGWANAALVRMSVNDEIRSVLQARVMCFNDPLPAAKRKQTLRVSAGSRRTAQTRAYALRRNFRTPYTENLQP